MARAPYEPPFWSSKPSHQFAFEVYKSGTLLGIVPLDEKEYYKLGRAADMVDVQIEHPSCSRVHCIVQHRKSGEVYLYDMHSAHGTFMNKKQLPPREYVQLHVGDMVQFGGSTRLYHLTGPEDLKPEEQEIKKRSKARKPDKPLPTPTTSIQTSRGSTFKASTLDEDQNVMWGQADDAQEDDELTESEILENPKYRTAKNRHLFERLDGRKEKLAGIIREIERFREKKAMNSGKLTAGQEFHVAGLEQKVKNHEEQIQSLELTITEDIMNEERGGNLRAIRRKRKKQQAFDDEDDDFYDRTGKSKKKKKVDENASNRVDNASVKVETEESLQSRLADLDMQKSNMQAKIKKLKQEKEKESKENSGEKAAAEPVDALDAYMSDVKSEIKKDTIKELQDSIKAVDVERAQVKKMLKIAKPSQSMQNLFKKSTPLVAKGAKKSSLVSHGLRPQVSGGTMSNSVKAALDRMKKQKGALPSSSSPKSTAAAKKTTSSASSSSSSPKNADASSATTRQPHDAIYDKFMYSPATALSRKSQEAQMASLRNNTTKEAANSSQTRGDATLIQMARAQRRVGGVTMPPSMSDLNKPANGHASRAAVPSFDESANESTWVPPRNQTGDGRTKANEKYGY